MHLLCICTLLAIGLIHNTAKVPQHTQTAISQKRLYILLQNFPSLLEYGSHKSLRIYVTARSKYSMQYSMSASHMLFYSHDVYIKQMSTPSSSKHLYWECTVCHGKNPQFSSYCGTGCHTTTAITACMSCKSNTQLLTLLPTLYAPVRPSVPSVDNSSEVWLVWCYKRGRLQQISIHWIHRVHQCSKTLNKKTMLSVYPTRWSDGVVVCAIGSWELPQFIVLAYDCQ